jgi:hypothetical protein
MTAHDLGLYAGAAAGVAAAIVWVIIPLARGLVRPDYRDDTDTAGDACLSPVPGVYRADQGIGESKARAAVHGERE